MNAPATITPAAPRMCDRFDALPFVSVRATRRGNVTRSFWPKDLPSNPPDYFAAQREGELWAFEFLTLCRESVPTEHGFFGTAECWLFGILQDALATHTPQAHAFVRTLAEFVGFGARYCGNFDQVQAQRADHYACMQELTQRDEEERRQRNRANLAKARAAKAAKRARASATRSPSTTPAELPEAQP